MIPYLILFFVVIVCAQILIYPYLRLPAIITVFLFLALFAGMRFETGWDYEAYQYFYNSLSNTNLFEIFSENGPVQQMGFEPGFALLIWLCNALHVNYQIILAIITVGLCIYSMYLLDQDALPLFIVIYLWYGYYHNFSIVRQGLSSALIFMAIAGNKSGKLLLCNYLIAISFHLSALVLSPIIWLLIKFSSKNILIGSIILCWVLSLHEIVREFLLPIVSLVAPGRWVTLLEAEQMTGKVGISSILIEYTIASLILLFTTKKGYATSFATGILIYKILTYGLFNDVSIIWERTSSFSDPMYAASLAIIFAGLVNKVAVKTKLIRTLIFFAVLVLGLYVFVKYNRMLGSEVRIEGERSHYERFIPYKSIVDY